MYNHSDERDLNLLTQILHSLRTVIPLMKSLSLLILLMFAVALPPTDSPGEYDAVINALKIHDDVIYSFD
jgi:hypothetical protein